jgi:hypothetical protein
MWAAAEQLHKLRQRGCDIQPRVPTAAALPETRRPRLYKLCKQRNITAQDRQPVLPDMWRAAAEPRTARHGRYFGTGTVAGICANLPEQRSASSPAQTPAASPDGHIGRRESPGTVTVRSITAATQAPIRGTYYAGGVVGRITAGPSAIVTHGDRRGHRGFLGLSASAHLRSGRYGSFTNCYNSGAVTANNAGALVGASNNSVFTLTIVTMLSARLPGV